VLKSIVLLFALLNVGMAQVEKRTCDHAAPPEGMHYVCSPKDSCDCRLEKNSLWETPGASEAPKPGNAPCAAASVKYFVAPAYPQAARAVKKQGTVTARLTVQAAGMPQIQIESGDPVFAESVTSALQKWRFAESERPRVVRVTFTFAIAGDATDSMRTTVAGSSPFNLVISASPPQLGGRP
jgi:TonB family protein